MKITQHIKAVFFDLDDTLLDDSKATVNYRMEFFNRHAKKIPYNFEAFNQIWENKVVTGLKELAKGNVTLKEIHYNKIISAFNDPSMGTGMLEFYINEYAQLYKNYWEIFNGSIEVLEYLNKKYILGVISNGDKKQQNEKISHFGLEKYFQTVISCEDAKFSKPEKGIFDFAANMLGLNNFNCVYIGDRFLQDVAGSKNAGMIPIWINRNNEPVPNGYESEIMIKELMEVKIFL